MGKRKRLDSEESEAIEDAESDSEELTEVICRPLEGQSYGLDKDAAVRTQLVILFVPVIADMVLEYVSSIKFGMDLYFVRNDQDDDYQPPDAFVLDDYKPAYQVLFGSKMYLQGECDTSVFQCVPCLPGNYRVYNFGPGYCFESATLILNDLHPYFDPKHVHISKGNTDGDSCLSWALNRHEVDCFHLCDIADTSHDSVRTLGAYYSTGGDVGASWTLLWTDEFPPDTHPNTPPEQSQPNLVVFAAFLHN